MAGPAATIAGGGERKLSDLARGEDDNRKPFAKWILPPKDSYLDPAPAYREMLRQRDLL